MSEASITLPKEVKYTSTNQSWHKLPKMSLIAGLVLTVFGFIVGAQWKQFLLSYVQTFMFFLSIGLGSLFLVIVHHIFDANWSVPTRRICENISVTFLTVLAPMWLPIMFFGPQIYEWMGENPIFPHALEAKEVYLNRFAWSIRGFIYFAVWIGVSHNLRKLSLSQDVDGSAAHTHKMRRWAAGWILPFAVTLTLAAIDWCKSMQSGWFSTMFGVYYFAGSVWVTLATLYMFALLMKKEGPLSTILAFKHFKSIGTLFFAFTVFYAYIAFSQYFIIWNANLPEETFWYAIRDQGSWRSIGMLMIFGHFFVPFLTLLRVDAKMNPTLMILVGIWAWVMHVLDLNFIIMPSQNPEAFSPSIFDISIWLLFFGVLVTLFLKSFRAHPAFPVKDPRLGESLSNH